MKTVNGLWYSREKFDNYKFSALIKLKTKDDYHNIWIYTTDTDKKSLLEFVDTVKKDSVISVELLNWCSKEQDDLTKEFLDDLKF